MTTVALGTPTVPRRRRSNEELKALVDDFNATLAADPEHEPTADEVAAWAAPNGSYSLSLRLVKPESPPPWRRVRMRSRRPVRILCG